MNKGCEAPIDDGQSPSIAALGQRLLDLLPAAEFAAQLGDRVDAWTPRRGACHENVARWVRERPADRAVRGWLHAPYLAPYGATRFVSHSLVMTARQELIDVTICATEPRHEFIRHPGSDPEFLALIADNGLPWIDVSLKGREPRLEMTWAADTR